jgi:hypothetical protein
VKYDPFSDSFIVVATAGNSGSRAVYLASLAVTSLHLAQPVALSIQRSGANLIVRWPASATGYSLQSSSSLHAPQWLPAGGVPEREGDSLKVTLPASGTRFFRLVK